MPDPVPPQQNSETVALRAALDAANRRASEEAQRRADAEGRLRTETGVRVNAQEAAIDNAIAQAQGEADNASDRWAALQAEGNFKDAATAMRQMTEATAKLDRFKAQKEWLASQRQQISQQQQQQPDPLEKFNSAERDWINRNPRYLEDPAFQRKVNAAAMQASELSNIVKDSPEYWQHIERTVYPERFAAGGTTVTTQDPPAATTDDDSAFSDTGDSAPGDDAGPAVALQQQHNMDLPAISVTPDAPAMRLDQKPQEPQQRAVGRGGGGAAAVAAPPSRRIAQAAARAAGGANRIEPTMEELQTARTLYDSIEPNASDRSDETIVRWYYALYNSPTHRSTRRRNWVFAERGLQA